MVAQEFKPRAVGDLDRSSCDLRGHFSLHLALAALASLGLDWFGGGGGRKPRNPPRHVEAARTYRSGAKSQRLSGAAAICYSGCAAGGLRASQTHTRPGMARPARRTLFRRLWRVVRRPAVSRAIVLL